MSKTNPSTVDQLSLQEAEKYITAFLQLQGQKSEIDAQMKAYKEKLKTFAESNRNKFDAKGNLNLSTGYLHFGNKTIAKATKKFDLLKFIKAFPELIKREFKNGTIASIMKDAEGKKKMASLGIKLTKVPQLSIVAAGLKPDEEE